MTSLEQELKKRNITMYRVMQLMGKDPKSAYGTWGKKFIGKREIARDDLEWICRIVSEETNDLLTPDDLKIISTSFLIE